MLLLLAACRPDPAPAPSPPTETSPGSPTDSGTEDSAGDSGPVPGTLVLCGGGAEGDIGDRAAWSAVYGRLLDGGDVTGDGRIEVAVLSEASETEWLPTYFESLGADRAFNLRVDRRAVAEEVAPQVQAADAVFLKGGDQGAYYDLWDGTALEDAIREVHARGGGVGGTSAGAMSLSGYVLAGGMDLISTDVLTDSHTSYLDDTDGGSGIHADFLGLLPGALVDTHFSTRARLGRLAGALARAVDDGAPADLLGIGIDEQTCLTVDGGRGTVSGVGSVVLLRPGAEAPLRIPGEPLVWAGLTLDRLTDGWIYDLDAGGVDEAAAPAGAEPAQEDGSSPTPSAGDWALDGRYPADEEGLEWVVDRWPDPFAVRPGSSTPTLYGALGLADAHDPDRRGANDEALFRALHDRLGKTGLLVGDGGALERRDGDGGVVRLRGGPLGPMATLVIDTAGVRWRSVSPWVSVQDAGDGALHAAGLVGMRLHVLYTDGSDGRAWDLVGREPVRP